MKRSDFIEKMSSETNTQKHPYQQIVIKEGQPYFLENKIIVSLLEEFGVDMFIEMLRNNREDYPIEDLEQFFQLIGIKCEHFIGRDDFTTKSKDDIRQKIIHKKQ